jgi:hypothetical protein
MGVIEKTTTGYTPSNYAIGFWVFSPGLFSPNVQGWSHFFQRLAKELPGITGRSGGCSPECHGLEPTPITSFEIQRGTYDNMFMVSLDCPFELIRSSSYRAF